MNEEHTNGADVDGAGAAAMETPVSVEETANSKGAEPAIPSAEPIDDPTRIEAENRIRYFRENLYPYAHPMARKEYDEQKVRLQVELVKFQNWAREVGERVIILFEGRDAAGKGGAIRRFTEHWNPRGARVGRARQALGGRTWAVVLPALYPPLPNRRGDSPLRPILVQPRRRGAGDGILRRQGLQALHTAGS